MGSADDNGEHDKEELPCAEDPADSPATAAPAPLGEIDEGDLPSLLRVFYQRLFPFKAYVRWLSYDAVPSRSFTHREFSFTLLNDVYLRWNSFNDLDEFKSEVLRLCPAKIDIGAVYSARPREKKMVVAEVFQPLEKELVFDIDLTDYDDVRTCCAGGDICRECWKFMTVAIKIIDAYLRDDFGFSSLLWVYSGRRGVHCWVADARARKLSNDVRRAIVSFIEVIKGGANQVKKANISEPLHPSLGRSCEILQSYFMQCAVRSQNILGPSTEWEKVLRLVPDDEIRGRLDSRWRESTSSSEQRWKELVEAINDVLGKRTKDKAHAQRRAALNSCLNNIMFQYTYPRLDDKVSIQINHLLKSPFCVHPKTGKVCVPIPVDNVDTFDPTSVPTVAGLIKEINAYDAEINKENERMRIADWEKTSLKPYVKDFEAFVKVLVEEGVRTRAAESASAMSF